MKMVIMNSVPMQAPPIREYGLFVDGASLAARRGATRDSIDPATGCVWAVAAEADTADVDRAVSAARRAFHGPWSRLVPRERGRLLRRIADTIESEAERLIALEIRDNGKTIREVTAQYSLIPEFYRYFAELADKQDGRVLPAERPGVLNYTLVEPVGVVAAITPWNSPGLQVAFKAAPALAAGNAVVVKPSEHTPVATLETARLFERAGFPAGVLNVVTGGPEAGGALASHPGVDLVAFTGSDATGRKVGAAAGQALSGVILELGGKSPQLVFADADLDQAVAGVVAGITSASGQTCIAGSRAYVDASVADELAERLVARFRALRLGNPSNWDTEIGPLAFSEHVERVEALCVTARAEGAETLVGGGRAPGDGFFFEPTIFAGLGNDATIMRDEVFGPVLGLGTFADEDEAVALANDSRYALGAGVWTTDLGRAHRLTHRLEAGTVYVNNYRLASFQTPLAGFKDSGVGFENGQECLAHFTRRKAVWIDYTGREKDPATT
jgi:(Z)-2-((N-methylformamido)methylene)-5-hydroxybutyrolactone dehydrogenase